MSKPVIAYLVAIHLVLGASLVVLNLPRRVRAWESVTVDPTRFGSFYVRILKFHLRGDDGVPEGATIFIGDSLTQALPVSAVTPLGVNYGIGGDTTHGVLNRIPQYRSLERARAVVLAIGINDIRLGREHTEILENYRQILAQLAHVQRVLVSAVLPVDARVEGFESNRLTRLLDPSRIPKLNASLEELAAQCSNCRFAPVPADLRDETGNLAETNHVGDGTHLAPAGYAIWIDWLASALAPGFPPPPRTP